MPNTTTYSFGDVVLVPFPFTDQTATKKRPSVVVSSAAYNTARPDVILMAITGRLSGYYRIGEVVVGDWKAAGLLKPSTIKPIHHYREVPNHSNLRPTQTGRPCDPEGGIDADRWIMTFDLRFGTLP